jgi:hypothetical protein
MTPPRDPTVSALDDRLITQASAGAARKLALLGITSMPVRLLRDSAAICERMAEHALHDGAPSPHERSAEWVEAEGVLRREVAQRRARS